ncbi:hypothetical protein [Azospirillum argentinense]
MVRLFDRSQPAPMAPRQRAAARRFAARLVRPGSLATSPRMVRAGL